DAQNRVLSGRAITWSSGKTTVATVNPATGLITAVDSGSATIIATSEGKTGSATVTVTLVPVASVTLAPPTAALVVGDVTAPFTVTLKDAQNRVLSGRAITWSSGKTTVATVNPATGLITAVDSGSATIIATSEGRTGQATAVVSLVPIATV